MKKIGLLLSLMLLFSLLAVPVVMAGEKEEVHFWYLWGGKEGEIIEQIISDYNESQDVYTVIGLSVPDQQKIITSIASGKGPDITDNFSSNVAAHASKGIYLQLDELIIRDGLNLSDFVTGALSSCKYNGKTYALPLSLNAMGLYYNKSLLKDAGFDHPPVTDKELLEMAIATTKVENDGTISVLGFPDFPTVYYTTNMSFALGGYYLNEEKTALTPDNQGTFKALKLINDYRNKFGYQNVQKFNASAGGYVSPNDPFILGEQALRIDGPWFINIVKEYNPDLEFGIAPLPYPQGHPELAGGGELSTSTMFIPVNASNKEGAWDFMKYICSYEGNKTFIVEKGDIPARKSLLDEKVLVERKEFQTFLEIVKKDNLLPIPSFDNQAEFISILNHEAELVMNGKKTPEEAMDAVKEQTRNLLGN